MTHLLFLGLEIKCVELGWLYLYRNSLDNLKIVARKTIYLERVVGEQPDLSDASKIVAVTTETFCKIPTHSSSNTTGKRKKVTYVVTALDRMSNESKPKKVKVAL